MIGFARNLSLTLVTTFALSGCMNTQNSNTTTEPYTNGDEVSTEHHMIQCPPFNPEMNMCTMQYDPVCVKEKQADGSFVFRTAGNSCSACGTPEAIEYYEGTCNK